MTAKAIAESLPSEAVKNLIFPTDTDTYSDHSKMIASSIITINITSSEVQDLAALYCCMKCKKKDKYKEGDCISVRWMGCIKGENGGFFNDDTIMVDVFIDGMSKHAKVSTKNKISLCGVKSLEQSQKVSECVISHVLSAQNYLEETRKRKHRQAMRWLRENSKGKEKSIKQYRKVKTRNGNEIEMFTMVSGYDLVLPKDFPEKYRKEILAFYERNDDIVLSATEGKLLHEDLVARLNAYRDFEIIAADDYSLKEIKVGAHIYYYNLGFVPDRTALAKFLRKKNFKTTYDFQCSACVKVRIENESNQEDETVHRKFDNYDSKFTFYPLGSIRHNATSYAVAKKDYDLLMKELFPVRESITISLT